ncbi:hypothetical protein DFH28DRAFT_923929 [Melampsora americana]|nr:hypothetical protein DFH28DRAFT_923929 [Melampsora americana]
MHTGYLPMRYVLCFPEGAQQWPESYKLLVPVEKRKLDDNEPSAAWRLFQYEMNGRSPGVYALQVHLPDEHEVYFWDDGDAEEKTGGPSANKTTLTEYFKLNEEDAVGSGRVKYGYEGELSTEDVLVYGLYLIQLEVEKMGGTNGGRNEEAMKYSQWLLELGSGRLQNTDEAVVHLKYVNVNLTSPGCEVDLMTIDWLYKDLRNLFATIRPKTEERTTWGVREIVVHVVKP